MSALVVLAGLPASGKSTLARALAADRGWTLLSVDPIEDALWRAGVDERQPTGLAAYVVAEDLARIQLALGGTVVIDAVNDAALARRQWYDLAAAEQCPLTFVEVFCGDVAEHRRRFETREKANDGPRRPTWEAVRERQAGFEAWREPRIRVDSMSPIDDTIARVLRAVDGAS